MPSLLLLLLLLLIPLLLLPATAFFTPGPAPPTRYSQPYPFSFSSLLATKQQSSITLPPTTHPSTQPTLHRFKRRVRRRAWHLAWRQRLPLFLPGWVDGWLERRWVEGEKAWERELLALANGWQQDEHEGQIEDVTEWVVEGPRPLLASVEKDDFPSSSSSSSSSSSFSSSAAFVLLPAPFCHRQRIKKAVQHLGATLRPILLPPILSGVSKRKGGRKGGKEAKEGEEEEIQEWHLYAAACAGGGKEGRRRGARGEVVLGKIGIKFREPTTRTLTAVDLAGAALFGWGEEKEEKMEGREGEVVSKGGVDVRIGGGKGAAGGERPLPVIVLVWCFVPPEARGRGYGERMMELVSETLLGGERKREGGRKGGRRRGYILLTVDDNGSGRLTRYYRGLGFKMAPSLSSEGCEVMLRPIVL